MGDRCARQGGEQAGQTVRGDQGHGQEVTRGAGNLVEKYFCRVCDHSRHLFKVTKIGRRGVRRSIREWNHVSLVRGRAGRTSTIARWNWSRKERLGSPPLP